MDMDEMDGFSARDVMAFVALGQAANFVGIGALLGSGLGALEELAVFD
jgi:hypothetical protein